MKLKAIAATSLKPTWLQTSDIVERGFASRIIAIPKGFEAELLDSFLVNGHQFVLLKDPILGCDRGFIYAPSVTIQMVHTSEPTPSGYPAWNLSMDFPSRVVRYMMSKGWPIASGYRERSIVYLEGLNIDGSENSDRIDEWNDVSCIISFDNNKPEFVFKPVSATTEAGFYYVQNPMNPNGCFRIAFGHHKAWRVGVHGGDRHLALVQCDNITGYRDLNKDGSRAGDKVFRGYDMGVNQHGSYTVGSVGRSSAGCLVREFRSDHERFMALVMKDPRYIADKGYIFDTYVIDGHDFAKSPFGYG